MITSLQKELLLEKCLKPEAVNGDPIICLERIQELLLWFVRLAEGHANPKWTREHAFELAYYIAASSEKGLQVDFTKLRHNSYVEGLNANSQERSMFIRLGVIKAQPFDEEYIGE